MIRWITEYLGTCSFFDFEQNDKFFILDVRDLVDKGGNKKEIIKERVADGIKAIEENKKVIVCCDYGISRSNAIASAILMKTENLSFTNAVRKVISATGETEIKNDILSTVKSAFEEEMSCLNDGVLITGSRGFIGTHLKKLLKTSNVICPSHDIIDLEKGAINLDLLVKENPIGTIIHLANPRFYTNNSSMGKTVVILKNVLDVCVENNLKLIYPSSWEVFSGYRSDRLIASENLAPLPVKTYGETKYLCEKLIEHYHSMYGLEYLIIRFSPIYGGGDKPKFIFNFIDKALKNEKIVTHNYLNGYPSLDLLHINDAVTALKLAYENEITGVINIGTGRGITTRFAAEKIVELLDSNSDVESIEIEGYAPNVVYDCKKAEKTLGWKPTINFEDGIEEFIKNNMIGGQHG